MKKFVILIAAALAAFSASTYAAQKYVQPTSDVGIYKNEIRGVNEQAITTVGVKDRLTVLKEGKSAYQVKTSNGSATGWVEKRFCASASGKSFAFDDAEVIGYLDNPTPIYIIDADNKDATPIKLDRSFADAVKSNVDRETVERTTR